MSEFWKDKSVCITGGTGFLGHHIINAISKSAHVQSLPRYIELTDNISAYDWENVDILIHCAAFVGGIGLNRKEPGRMIRDNLQMGLNIMQAAWGWEIPKTVVIGTTCAYPEHTPTPFTESELWNGYPEPTNAPYGIAKRTIAELQRAYHEQYGVVSNHLILANLYGPGDNFNPQSSHVIPAIIRKVHHAQQNQLQTVQLWGNGHPTRDFLFVEDAAKAVLLAAEKLDSPEPVNIGTGVSYPIWEVASMIKEIMGYTGAFRWDTGKPNGQMQRRLDTTRAKALLGWEAETKLRAGLEKTIAWFRANVGKGI